MPDTLVENEAGKQTKAENITGLFPRPVPLPESNTNAPSTENPFTSGITKDMYNQPPTSDNDHLTSSILGFDEFITPSWITIIWGFCVFIEIISFFASSYIVNMIASGYHNDIEKYSVFTFGIIGSIILHLLSLLTTRVFLELINVVFRIEENTRGIRKNTRRIEEFTLAIAEQQ